MALLYTGVLSVATILVGPFNTSGRFGRWIAEVWSRGLLLIGRVGVQVQGLENIPQGPAVYASNHGSALDIPIVFAHVPVDFRIIHKRSLRWLPLLGQAMWAAGHIAIDRSHPFRARRSLDAAANRIRQGTSVIVFPEGTRSRDASVGRFKRGSFALALDAGVPVVPFSIVGVKDVVPEGLTTLQPGTVQVFIHPPVPTDGRRHEEAEALAREVRETVVAGCDRRAPVEGRS